MKIYTVKEIFYTIQGEGQQAGRPAVFCRFSGCNLWDGTEKNRSKAICQFCDTDFVGISPDGGKFLAEDLAQAINSLWPKNKSGKPFVVFTGGEPLLQLDEKLIAIVKKYNFEIAVESNGTILAPAGIDWLCISPKAGSTLKQKEGQELKLVFPQTHIQPDDFAQLHFQRFSLQPLDNQDLAKNIQLCIEYCKNDPQWQLSIQTHKITGIR
jgi:7-carboxy-7-deazaguanine synthase